MELFPVDESSFIFVSGNGGEVQWCFSQVKGTIEEEVTEGKFLKLISECYRNSVIPPHNAVSWVVANQ